MEYSSVRHENRVQLQAGDRLCQTIILDIKMKICFIILSFIIPTLLAARTFRINNRCNQKLWFGIQGQPLIYSGGFDVDAGSTKDISVPDGWVKTNTTCAILLQFIV